MGRFKKMTEIVDAMPSGEDKIAMESALVLIEKLEGAQADYDAMSNKECEGLPVSVRRFFGENVLDDFDENNRFK